MSIERAQQDIAYSPVSRATLQDHVYGRLREMILNGAIEPGRTVTMQSLSDAFGVSAMPVREAMRRLVAEKALTVVSGRSVGIPHLTSERLEDLRRVRLEIEGTAVAWAADRISRAEFDHLDDLIADMDRAETARDRASYLPANRDFHFTIYKAAGSLAMLSIIESLWLQVGPYFNILEVADNWWSSNLEHRTMRDALARNGGCVARKALQADIDGAAASLAKALRRVSSQGATKRVARG